MNHMRLKKGMHVILLAIESFVLSAVLMYMLFQDAKPILRPIVDGPADFQLVFSSGQEELMRKIRSISLLYLTQESPKLSAKQSMRIDLPTVCKEGRINVRFDIPISGFRLDFPLKDGSLEYPLIESISIGGVGIPIEDLRQPHYEPNPFPCYLYRPKLFLNGHGHDYWTYTAIMTAVLWIMIGFCMLRRGDQ